jgi:hypothetical protein
LIQWEEDSPPGNCCSSRKQSERGTLVTAGREASDAKAKAKPAYRFYALYDKIYRKDVLLWAWGCCRANGGSCGVDGQSFAGIEAKGVELKLRVNQQKTRICRHTAACRPGIGARRFRPLKSI